MSDEKKKPGKARQVSWNEPKTAWGATSGAAAPQSSTSFAEVEDEQKKDAERAEKWPCAADEFAKLTNKTISKEVWRGVCFRRRTAGDKDWQAVDTVVDNTGKLELYCLSKKTYDQSKKYQVILPAVMLYNELGQVTGPDSDRQLNQYQSIHLMKNYRRQFGVHLMVNHRYGNVQFMHCCWLDRTCRPDLARKLGDIRFYYADSRPRAVNCVYPCQRTIRGPDTEDGQESWTQELVLGLTFCNRRYDKDKGQVVTRTRTFNKPGGQQKPNEFCFDVTENFIAGTDQEYSFKNERLFPKDRSASAFYVCRGAKLVVTDERYDQNIQKNGKFSHCRNLFLEGSLVVVSGVCSTSISTIGPIPKDSTDLKDSTNPNRWMSWTDFHHHLRPDYSTNKFYGIETNVDSDAKDQTIAGNNRMVYFLGAVESEHNSICWKLEIRNSFDQIHHRAELFVPEGGYFEDITSWRYGFQLIRARHCYHRLYESVLEMTDRTSVPTSVKFQVATDRMLQRILCINQVDNNARQTVFCPDYKALQIPDDFESKRHDTDRDLRRYMALQLLSCARMTKPQTAAYPRLIHNQSMNTVPGWQQVLPSPPLYPNCFQTDSAGSCEMVAIDRGLRVVRINPVPGESLDAMQFGIVNQDRTDRVLHQAYKLHRIKHYGHLWQSHNAPIHLGRNRENPGRNRLARDYRWQKVNTSSEVEAQQPEMLGLLLVKTDLDPKTLPWVAENKAGNAYRFGYTDQKKGPNPAGVEYPLKLER